MFTITPNGAGGRSGESGAEGSTSEGNEDRKRGEGRGHGGRQLHVPPDGVVGRTSSSAWFGRVGGF